MRNEHPEPQLKRDKWQTLNGEWEFSFGEDAPVREFVSGEAEMPMRISVPFAYQSELSGIGDKSVHEVVRYRKRFTLSPALKKAKGVVLRFLAVDYECRVWVNGCFAAAHRGGYGAFYVDITKYLTTADEQIVAVEARDTLDECQPRGKQSWLPEAHRCWYTQTTGIWQSVWLEAHDGDFIKRLTVMPDPAACSVKIETALEYGKADGLTAEIVTPGGEKITFSRSLSGKRNALTADIVKPDLIDEIQLWSPENPVIYGLNLTLTLGGKTVDAIKSYFAFREIRVDGDTIYLNNLPLKFKLVLDQGYWADGGMTPPSTDALKQDILTAKAMGFNGARKHQKLEDPYFYYYADTLGFMVWSETPSAYRFNADEARALTETQFDVIERSYNHPSVVAYVPINESWGVKEVLYNEEQKSFARSLYRLVKSLDPSRLTVTNDGWENLAETDIISVHDYSKYGDEFALKYGNLAESTYPMWKRLMARGETLPVKPLMLTEYGGIAIDTGGGWGYSGAEKSVDDFFARFTRLSENAFAAFPAGACYTQLTDVEQEQNGLLDHRHRPKFSVHTIREIMDKFDEKSQFAKKEKIL